MIRLFEPGFFDEIASERPAQTKSSSEKTEMSSSDLIALAEASSWCDSLTITATPEETPDIRRRRDLVVEAGKLYSEAYKRGETYPDGEHYERGKQLFEQADMSSLVLLRAQLRSAELLPAALRENLSTGNFADASLSVVTKRRALLKKTNCSICVPRLEDAGRLLHYWPDENLACGAAEYSSNGFFDLDNVPPWDTWISFDGSRLVSWVPAILIPLAQAGIDANPEACISWAA